MFQYYVKKNMLLVIILFITFQLTSCIGGSDSLNGNSQFMNDIIKIQTENHQKFNELPTNGTEGYYLSPHALGKTDQVQRALSDIVSKIKVQKTTYNHSDAIYTLDNFVIELDYNDGKQNISIADQEEVSVSGGTVFFGYRFNYSVVSSTKHVNGYGHGSVYSDSLMYKKHLIINPEGYLEWALPKAEGYQDLTIKNRMGIKRIQPFDQNDYSVLQQMLDRAFQSIQPSNIQTQLLQSFNSMFFPALNDTLNHQVFGNNYEYSYHHPTKGPLNMTIVHHLYGFSVDKQDGYKIIYVTQIDGHQKQTTCNITVPNQHQDFLIYGGIQNIHLNCLYQDVLNYYQSRGWLDTALNSDWEVNAFQFYAGDLYDIINNLYTKVNPRSLLEGQCKSRKNNLQIKSSRQFESNTYGLKVDFDCTVKTTSKTAQSLDVLQFVAETKFYLKASADKLTLNFEVVEADVTSLTFTPVNNFIVSNMNLALFKATQVIRKNLHWKVFGSGYSTLPRQSPRTRVDKDTVIYWDASATAVQVEAAQASQKILNNTQDVLAL